MERNRQSKKRSFIEAWTNIAIGYTINFTANLFILPLFGFNNLTVKKNIIIGMIYTVIALIRVYCIRRWFTKGD